VASPRPVIVFGGATPKPPMWEGFRPPQPPWGWGWGRAFYFIRRCSTCSGEWGRVAPFCVVGLSRTVVGAAGPRPGIARLIGEHIVDRATGGAARVRHGLGVTERDLRVPDQREWPGRRSRVPPVPGVRFGTERRVKALKCTAAFVSSSCDLVDYERRIIRSPEVDLLLRWRMVAAARNYCVLTRRRSDDIPSRQLGRGRTRQ
jgi:hypothetical protein